MLTALSVAGLPTERFLFAGFLPSRRAERRRTLTELAAVPATLVLLEAPHRLAASLEDMAAILGPRPAALARELTKMFEEVRRDTLDALAEAYAAAPAPKGEVTLVIGAPLPAAPVDEAEIDRSIRNALATLSPRDAAATIARELGLPRRLVYTRALKLKAEDG